MLSFSAQNGLRASPGTLLKRPRLLTKTRCRWEQPQEGHRQTSGPLATANLWSSEVVRNWTRISRGQSTPSVKDQGVSRDLGPSLLKLGKPQANQELVISSQSLCCQPIRSRQEGPLKSPPELFMWGTCLLRSNTQTRLVREQLSSAEFGLYHLGHLRTTLAKTQRPEVRHTSRR